MNYAELIFNHEDILSLVYEQLKPAKIPIDIFTGSHFTHHPKVLKPIISFSLINHATNKIVKNDFAGKIIRDFEGRDTFVIYHPFFSNQMYIYSTSDSERLIYEIYNHVLIDANNLKCYNSNNGQIPIDPMSNLVWLNDLIIKNSIGKPIDDIFCYNNTEPKLVIYYNENTLQYFLYMRITGYKESYQSIICKKFESVAEMINYKCPSEQFIDFDLFGMTSKVDLINRDWKHQKMRMTRTCVNGEQNINIDDIFDDVIHAIQKESAGSCCAKIFRLEYSNEMVIEIKQIK